MFDINEKGNEKSKKINAETKRPMEDMEARLAELQREMQAAKIPTIIVFEGFSASGKGRCLSYLMRSLDPRGFKVHSMTKPTELDRRYPQLHRYWLRIPANGGITIYERSWYRCIDFTTGKRHKRFKGQELDRIIDFEAQLAAEGYLIIKFFLNVSRKEQKHRYERLCSVKSTAWRVGKDDLKQQENFNKVYDTLCGVLDKTDIPCAPWHVINSEDSDDAVYSVYSTVIESMETALEHKACGVDVNPILPDIDADVTLLPSKKLSEIDLSVNADEVNYKKRLKAGQARLFELQNELYRRRIPLILAFEGWDAAGKGGAIKRVTQALDPRGFEVVPVASPTPDEKTRHFLWRFWRALPKSGHTTIFDRTWYGRVLVERIEGFASETEWKRAYDEINRFEKNLTDEGAIVMKFWLHIDSDEQLARFTARQNTPSKQWKITDEDWRNRAKWGDYEVAVDDMVARTNTSKAPWVIVESNDKKYARIRVIESIIDFIEHHLAALPEDK